MKDEMLFQRAWVLDVNSKVFPSPLYPHDVRNKPTAIDFASRRIVEEKKADEEESQVTIFFKTTSITALNQVQYTNSYLLKSYWIILFLIGLVVSIFQSYLVISNFLKFGVLEKTRLTLQGNIEFPSVTVCVNMPLKWDNKTYEDDSTIRKFVDDLLKFYGVDKDLDKGKRHLAVINALSAVDRKKRHSLGVATKDFVLFCSARELDENFEDCLDHLHESNSLYHGNCATFNPKLIDDNINQKWLLSTDLNMALKFYTTPEYSDPRREVSLMVIIHQAGSAPVLKEALHISAGDFLEIDVFKKDLHRLPWPYTSECLNAWAPKVRQKSIYYDEDHPYIYSIEACIDSCIQNLTLHYCNCFLSNYVLKSTAKRSVRECEASCEAIPPDDLTKMCGCKNPCDNFEYTVKVQRHPEKFYMKDFAENFMEKKLKDEEFEVYKEVGAVGFSISLTSQFVDVMNEHPEEQALNMLGNIGGVFGLWIGISIMSVFEVLVSIYDGMVRCICKRLKYRSK